MLAKLYDALSEALVSHGMSVPEIGSRKFTRFPGPGQKSSDKSSWIMMHEDGEGATFGNFREMIDVTVRVEDNRHTDPAQAAHNRKMVAEAKRRREFEMQQAWEEAAKKAQYIWSNTAPLPYDYPYLQQKFLPAYDARLYKGTMVLPVWSFDGRLQTLQFISQNGEKRFLTDGKMEGGLYRFGDPSPDENGDIRIDYGEGWATMATNFLITGRCSVAAFNLGNLPQVAKPLRETFPGAKIKAILDNDRFTDGNPGITIGVEAAVEIGASYYIPEFGLEDNGTDLNDVYTSILKKDPAAQEIWAQMASQGNYHWVFDES